MATPRPPLAVRTYVVRNLRRIVPTLIILTFVVVIVIVILSSLRGLKDGTLVYANEFKHLTVVLPKKDSAISKEVRRAIADHPSVDRVLEARNGFLRIHALIATVPYQFRAVTREDMEYMMARCGLRLIAGTLPGPGTNGVALHENFMKANGWKIGAEFGMDVDDDDWMPGRFRVVGILAGETPLALASFEYVARPELYFFSAKLWERILVFPKEGRMEEMNAFLRSQETEIRMWDYARAVKEIGRSFDRLLLIIDFVSILLIFVVALVVGLLNNIFFEQRMPEFAILLAIGHTQRRLLWKVFLESAVIMAAAWIVGTAFSFSLLAAFRAAVLEPRGIILPLFQRGPVLVSMALPIVGQLFSTATVLARLRRLDPVQIIERRG